MIFIRSTVLGYTSGDMVYPLIRALGIRSLKGILIVTVLANACVITAGAAVVNMLPEPEPVHCWTEVFGQNIDPCQGEQRISMPEFSYGCFRPLTPAENQIIQSIRAKGGTIESIQCGTTGG